MTLCHQGPESISLCIPASSWERFCRPFTSILIQLSKLPLIPFLREYHPEPKAQERTPKAGLSAAGEVQSKKQSPGKDQWLSKLLNLHLGRHAEVHDKYWAERDLSFVSKQALCAGGTAPAKIYLKLRERT